MIPIQHSLCHRWRETTIDQGTTSSIKEPHIMNIPMSLDGLKDIIKHNQE